MANPKYANSWVLNCLMDVNATDTQLIQHEVSRMSPACSTDTEEEVVVHHTPPLHPSQPAKSALSVPGIARKGRKQTSIMEDGHVLVPGKDLPHPKSLECIDHNRQRSRTKKSPELNQLQQIISWKKE
ncbi:uncharacterized protein LOC121837171 [Ixodes scapularis]|uniref:uncharacterized protein LOC121837171 n=1 Tax=Ixodes scapularis TaxID=6945 RepID=UPI001C38F260|nr:uncharacterized protein LOC121837171 [Ixodes scapularis]